VARGQGVFPLPRPVALVRKATLWIKRIQTRLVDAEGYVHLVYDVPGMGVEYDWDWIQQHEIVTGKNR